MMRSGLLNYLNQLIMAKDPAFLFYPGDWQGGTTTFTRHLKGAYIDILIALFNNGPLSLEEIKTVLGSDFGQSWPALQKKFKFENGLYFNERLKIEMEKRSNYTASRRKNAKHMLRHMENENENESITENENGRKGEKIEIVFPFESKEFLQTWDFWKKYKSEQYKFKFKSALTEQASLNHLSKLSGGEENKAIAIIHQSIENTWKGFFDLKNNNNGNATAKNNGLGPKSGGFGILTEALRQVG